MNQHCQLIGGALVIVCCFVTAPGAAMAQDITLDTVIGLAGTDTLDIRTAIEFRIRVSNSSGDTYYGATNGFRLYSPDGATWVPHIYYDTTIVQFPSVDTIVDTTYFGRWADNIYIDSIWDGGYFVNFYSDHDDSALTPDLFGQGSDTIGFGGYQQEGWGLYDSFDEIMYTIRLDSIPASSGGKTICLDSAFYRPTGYWRWADPDTIPSWDGPHCYFIKYLIPPGPGESVVGGGGEEESLYKPGEVEFATEVETAYRHFERYRGRFRMKDPRNELRLERADRDKWGMIHVRFNQFHGNARVIGRDVIVHLHPVGTIDRITNGYVPDINVSPAYSVSVGSAVGAVLLDRAALSESEYNVEKSELIVDTWGDSVRLAWQIAVTADDRSDRWTYLVDAHSGDKIRELKSALAFDPEQCGIGEGWGLTGYHHHIDVTYDSLYFSGSYHWYLFDHSRRDVNSNPGCMHGHDGNMDSNAEIASIDNGLGYEYSDSWQIDSLGDTIITFDSTTEFRRAAVDAQVYTGHIYDWLLERFGWNSWNNQGSSMNIVGMHRTTQHDHCIWADSRVTCYTPTDTIYRRPLSACPEIVAHEWIHAVEDATDHLFDFSTVQGKALGEAVPAILGNAFLQWYDPNNSDPWRAGQNGFKYGDSCWTDFADTHSDLIPSENGPQADYWGPEGSPVDTLWCLDTIPVCNWRLRGIAQKWFYLLSEGGSHYGVSVNPLNGGVDEAADLVFYSLLYEFSAEEDYQTFAMKTLSTSLYMDICTGAGCPGRDTLGPKDTTRARLVQEAWAAVGVLDPYQDSDGDNWSDLVDNCPDTANPDQQDTDKDGIGDICESSCCALRGDMDHDGSVNIADLTYLIAFSFKSGPEAHCVEEGDVNGDDSQDVSDVTFLVSYMFKNGGVPPACSI